MIIILWITSMNVLFHYGSFKFFSRYKKILLYGKIVDEDYYQQKVVPMLGDNVIHAGFVEDKQGMYDSIAQHIYPLIAK